MPRCCGGATCACKVIAGPRVTVIGDGTAAHPFIISGDVSLGVVDTKQFDLYLGGIGTSEDPWTLSITYAETAQLTGIPDVNAPAPLNGQVLRWDSATARWIAGSATTAAAGSVLHDTSLTGDGSAGAPLTVQRDAQGFIVTKGTGLSLSDEGKNQMVRAFGDADARSLASPVPDLNTLSVLDSRPGVVEFWTGTMWAPILGAFDLNAVSGGEMLALSGSYAGGRTTMLIRRLDVITDGDGIFDVLAADVLEGRAGVLMVHVQEHGPQAWRAMVEPTGSVIRGTAYRLDTGTPYPSQALTATVTALVY